MTTTVEQLLARLGSGIESTPGVRGGDSRIAGTRIPVWTLERYRRLGLTEAQILGAYPGLRAADLVNAWSYVADHADEIERQILENEEGDSDSPFHVSLLRHRPCFDSAGYRSTREKHGSMASD